MKGFVLAGTNSGSGKTTITMGLLKLLKQANLSIAAFKAGPDYIDPMFHAHVIGEYSYNLDSQMINHEVVKHLFAKHSKNKDIAVVEGVMGLFDGVGEDSAGSTAEIAQILDLPVILCVSCKSMYQSVAAIVLGFINYNPKIRIAGLILNHVSSDDQYQFLKQLIELQCGVTCFGYLPPSKDIALESRHLGLVQAVEDTGLDAKIQKIADLLSKSLDLNLLLDSVACNQCFENQAIADRFRFSLLGIKIAVAYDDAFRFYYRDNLELLTECGAILHYFSPLKDKSLPANCDAVYLGGGYPEVFAEVLSQNTEMLSSIFSYAQSGGSIYAECGGLMYLTKYIEGFNASKNNMVGFFDAYSVLTDRLQNFGYCKLRYNAQTTIAHEFHRSKVVAINQNNDFTYDYEVGKLHKSMQWRCGLKKNNVLAAYPHVHFYSNPHFFKQIIDLWTVKTT